MTDTEIKKLIEEHRKKKQLDGPVQADSQKVIEDHQKKQQFGESGMTDGDIKKFIEEHRTKKQLREELYETLDDICTDHLGDTLPSDQYRVWLQYGFSLTEIEDAIARTGTRQIDGGTSGLIRYASGILWQKKKEATSQRKTQSPCSGGDDGGDDGE